MTDAEAEEAIWLEWVGDANGDLWKLTPVDGGAVKLFTAPHPLIAAEIAASHNAALKSSQLPSGTENDRT